MIIFREKRRGVAVRVGIGPLVAISVILVCAVCSQTVFAAEDEEEEGKTKCPDKSQYKLFNPTPANCLREFDPDRPDVTDNPFTIDAGHIQFESSLFSYALSRPDRHGWPKGSMFSTRISGSGLPTTPKLTSIFRLSISSIRN